jgi:hypothetical protein
VQGTRVLVPGITFKENCTDIRNVKSFLDPGVVDGRLQIRLGRRAIS